MTLAKAIIVIRALMRPRHSVHKTNALAALNLGQEAIQRITDNRRNGLARIWTPLPSETRDESWEGH